MHIVIDSGSYHSLNVGDVAMMQTAIARLRELWPTASIAVVTNAPETLASHCPGIQPVPLSGRIEFQTDRWLGRGDRLLPVQIADRLNALHDRIRRRWPATLASIIAGKHILARRRNCFAALTWVNAMKRADLVLTSGAGVFTDAFAENARGVLDTLEFAVEHGVPAAALGQGLGPLTDSALLQRMSEVLPRLDLIGLRERVEGSRLLNAIGVPPERVRVTGDDALEMAHRCKRQDPGGAIGVNVRVAGYAGVGTSGIETVRSGVRQAADRLAAPLIALPIAHHPDCHDGDAIRRVLSESDIASPPTANLDTPARAIAAVSQCRLVVTGSYHAGVFAMAQGIPVVAIAASRYYLDKFGGLADLFGGGCETVDMASANACAGIEAAIVRAWTSAPFLRERLLKAAEAQIECSKDAYRLLAGIVGSETESAPAWWRRFSVAKRRLAAP